MMVRVLEENERAWKCRKLPEDKRCDADAVMRVRESPSGTVLELCIKGGPEVDVQAERLQVKPIRVMSIRVRNEDIAQYGYTSGCKRCGAARAGKRQQAHDEACRTTTLQELM